MAGFRPQLDAVADRLASAGCVAPRAEAAALVAAAPDPSTLESWVSRREEGEPPAWITGRIVFCDQPMHIAPGVFVPRHQTEDLARRAAALLPRCGRALDLCTGAGVVAAHLAASVPSATVIGIDRDATAVQCARRNGVVAAVGDVAEPLRPSPGFDVVTAVAPYVPTPSLRLLPSDVQRYEPRVALDGGTDGLDVVRRVVAAAGSLLRPGGWLLTEVGGDQDIALAPALEDAGFDPAHPWWDDDGDLRGIAVQATG